MRSNRTAWALAFLLLVTATVAVTLVRSRNNSGEGSSRAATDAIGIEHVHALGIDPADGMLYAATHYGLFRLPTDGAAERVAGRFQDTMGFTVVGPNHFLGSGHPDLRDGRPPRLGLIESTDAGETWTALSLEGDADFHAVAVTPTVTYGYESSSGQVMATSDGRQWDVRSTLELHSLGVDPERDERLIGIGQAGVVRSDDGGRTWTSLGRPEVIGLSWAPTGDVWAGTSSGALLRSDDGGLSWQEAGVSPPGALHVLLADGGALYAAVADDAGVAAIYESRDDAATWRLRYRDRSEDE